MVALAAELSARGVDLAAVRRQREAVDRDVPRPGDTVAAEVVREEPSAALCGSAVLTYSRPARASAAIPRGSRRRGVREGHALDQSVAAVDVVDAEPSIDDHV